MTFHCMRNVLVSISFSMVISVLSACSGASTTPKTASASDVGVSSVAVRSLASVTVRRADFAGAFFRPQGPPPYGVISAQSSQLAPQPYPTPGSVMLGSNGYCDEQAANGASIDGSYQIDVTKLNDVIYLGARWTRMPVPQFFADLSHIFGPGNYAFGSLDAAQCISFLYHYLKPIIEIDAGPVQYNATPGTFSPTTVQTYESVADYGQWCSTVAAHERAAFPSVTQYSLPGNEVNNNPQLFPGGEPQISAYSKACYAAIKAANPKAFVYGFELSMDGSLNAPAFVSSMAALGCKVGTCYDGIAIHLTLNYPIPSSTTPCYPNPGGLYSMQCVTDIETAARAPVHVLISETVYPVPGFVPDEAAKAAAVTAEYSAFAANPTIDGVLYANIDECGLYPTGYFEDGCLIDTSGNPLPAWNQLQWLISQNLI